MKRRHPEQTLHAAVANYLRVALRAPTVWTTFPAGGGGRVRGGILKGAGLRPGFPDLLVLHPHPAGGTTVLGLEIKAPTGRPSAAQEAMDREFARAHAAYEFCRSLEDIENALRTNGIPVHATVAGNGSLWPRRAA